MIDQLKDLKDTYESARQQIDKSKEPTEDLITLHNFLKALSSDPSLIKQKMDKDYKRYFFEDFTAGVLKRLTKEKSKNDKYLEIIGQILEQFLLVFVQQLKEGQLNYPFFDSIRQIFDYDTLLHQLHYQVPEEQLKKIKINSATQEWRKDLKEGDMVDAIQDEVIKCSGWSQARISSVDGDTLHVEFIYDTKNTDRYLDRWSVDIAQFESKTKEMFEWKKSVQVKMQVDGHEKTSWYKSTILDMKEQTVGPNRTVKLAYVAFRIYVEKSLKSDEVGPYEGWSNRFDEWVAVYSPRIQPLGSKTQKGVQEDFDIDEELDYLFNTEQSQTKVYAVPRLRKCTSSLYIRLINQFGAHGGFEAILDILKASQESEEIDLNIVSVLLECVSKPYLIYHTEFQKEYGPKVVVLVKAKLKHIPDKVLRDVKRERLEGVVKGIDYLQRRTTSKDQREIETENLKLELCLTCLRSLYLDRKIQGLKDLNQIIKDNKYSNSKVFTNEFLIEWMHTNDVFSVLFDNKKTHLQIVQRCADILKLLLTEDKLTLALTAMFWNLSKSDYKPEVYKIVNEGAALLKQEHIDFIFEQIQLIPPEKITLEEFQCLGELGKYAKDESFKEHVSNFFLKVICESDNYKEELVTNCITKFCEMVKDWDLTKKHHFFLLLVQNIQNNKSSLPSLRLLRHLIKDHKTEPVGQYPPQDSSKTEQNEDNQAAQEQELEDLNKDEFTLDKSIKQLLHDHKLIDIVIASFVEYTHQAMERLNGQSVENRKKLYLVSSKYSHHEEVDERLTFLKYIASISDFKISKHELGVIYSLLVTQSKVPSDYEEFLIWCKTSCEQSSQSVTILDLNEVGEFFIEKMASKELDMKTLLVVGFEYLQHYFLSVNEKTQKLIKAVPKKKEPKNQFFGYGYGPLPPGFFNSSSKKTEEEEETNKTPVFKLMRPPSEMESLDIVWKIALECENKSVVPQAISFLIKVYTQLDEELQDQRIIVQDELIEKCISILRHSSDNALISRVLEIIKNIIYEAERKGTGGVQPHNAVLKGELLENVKIRNLASSKKGNLLMSVYSNTTVWELRKEVAHQLDLAPKYLKLEKADGTLIKDLDNGKTLSQLGFQTNEQLSASKVSVEEEVAPAPILTPENKLTERAKEIFSEWFILYSDEQGAMTKDTCALFIKGCTGEVPGPTDDRIQNLFKAYDLNGDGRIERDEFLTFYENAAKQKVETVRENMRAHNIRADLKKLSEIQEESSYSKEDMPRYKIAKNQDYFDLLVSILDRQDSASEQSWDLIQMLATNQVLYRRVLELQTAKCNDNSIDWNKFFDTHSVYKLLYTLQIVEAVMEDGNGSERILVIQEENKNKKVPPPPPLVGPLPLPPGIICEPAQTIEEPAPQETKVQRSTSIVEDDEIDRELRSGWTRMFLDQNGFEYILNVFLNKFITAHSRVGGEGHLDKSQAFNATFELKHIAFLLKLLRIFITAAFSTYSGESKNEGASKFKELRALMEGERAQKITSTLDFRKLQAKILAIVSQILEKPQMIFEDKLIIENALSLWVGLVEFQADIIGDLQQFKGEEGSKIATGEDFILNGLLYCPQDKIRDEFKDALIKIAQADHADVNKVSSHLNNDKQGEVIPPLTKTQQPLLYFLRILSEHFSEISRFPCRQYFDLFCDLIDQYFTRKHEPNLIGEYSFDAKQILVLIIDKVKEYNLVAAAQSDDEGASESTKRDTENIYIGLIQLTGKIIDNFDIQFSEEIVEKNNLIDEIFVNFLFSSVFKESSASKELTTINVKKASIQRQLGQQSKQGFGKKSKDAAYKLLNSLIKKSPLLMNSFLEKSMLPLTQLIRRIDGWNYTPPGSSDRQQKYCGLKNLGCICYMNSMLQQFYMIPSFRYNLLCVDDKLPEELVEYKGYQVDDNVLHQFQKLIAHLELSERSDYNPFEFCFAFKDLDGNPTNTGEQKDAQEFLNLIFDRVESQLRGTSRKYLLQSVFGGQTCSQMVCQECGKVKNRIEDFYNLSLPVKDIKSMEQSLMKMIEGEVINDYQCDGCNKKVDISRRTLISQAPNVLIVHLQRIIFNFDTFRNDKINSLWEFPYQLDLKPYSFYEVMRKENRIPAGEQDQTQDEDNQWPQEEDCFEYKLVGVNVHSGTAMSGHYWSYINTMRGFSEPESQGNPLWDKTENEPWMEFNDSTVKDFNFDKLKDDCFGGEKKSSSDTMGGWSFSDSSYGKSAYMLVYERRQKRPIKILLEDQESTEGQWDEKKQERFKFIDYKDGVEEIRPNQIYKQVHEDNMKFEFENDIYSQEFFDFATGIIKAATALNSPACALNAMKVGKKAIFEIVAKCFYNKCITEMMEAFIALFKQYDDLCAVFLEQCYEEDRFEYLFQLLLECSDSQARTSVGLFLKFVLETLKVKEQSILYDSVTNEKGEEYPAALSTRFILQAIGILNTKAAKNWMKLDTFLEVLHSFALGENDAEIGLEFYFRTHFIEKACDFVLGKKSPLCQLGEKRTEMGGSYSSPNFSALIKIITRMITDESGLLVKYPLNDVEKQMLLQHELLKVMLGSSQGSKQFGKCLANMCRDNLKLSKKVAKVFIRSINASNYDTVKNYLTALKPFVLTDDSLKLQKLEWIFGFSQVVARKGYREERFKYGLETITHINEESTEYTSPLIDGPTDDPLLGLLLKCKGKLETFAANCLKELLSLMVKDADIARFVYNAGPPTYQTARYIDWIKPYLESQRLETEKNSSYTYMKARYETIIKSLKLYLDFEQKHLHQYQQEEVALMDKMLAEGAFSDLDRQEDWFAYQSTEVIRHFPPQLIIGKQVTENAEKEFYVNDEHPHVKVVIYEIINEYNYSNPTHYFNVSLPHIDVRTSNYESKSYLDYRKLQLQLEKEGQAKEGGSTTPQEDPEIKIVNWIQRCKTEPILLRVTAISKSKQKTGVIVSFSGQANARLPLSYFKETLLENDAKCLGHIIKIDPTQPWGDLQVHVTVKEKDAIPAPPKGGPTPGAIFIGDSSHLGCGICNKLNSMSATQCSECGNLLVPDGVSIALDTNSLSGQGQMEAYFDVGI